MEGTGLVYISGGARSAISSRARACAGQGCLTWGGAVACRGRPSNSGPIASVRTFFYFLLIIFYRERQELGCTSAKQATHLLSVGPHFPCVASVGTGPLGGFPCPRSFPSFQFPSPSAILRAFPRLPKLQAPPQVPSDKKDTHAAATCPHLSSVPDFLIGCVCQQPTLLGEPPTLRL